MQSKILCLPNNYQLYTSNQISLMHDSFNLYFMLIISLSLLLIVLPLMYQEESEEVSDENNGCINKVVATFTVILVIFDSEIRSFQ